MTIFIRGRAERYGNYCRAVVRAGGQVRFSEDPGDAEGCGALLLPGGGDLEPWRYGQENRASRNLEPDRDGAELALLARFAARGRPVLGICRGLQVINVFFGGTLIQDLPGHSALEEKDRLHPARTAPSFLLPLCGPRCVVNSAHHQAADRLGQGLEAAQWAEDGVLEALYHRALPVWAVQWHPERLDRPEGGAVFRAFLALAEAVSGNG